MKNILIPWLSFLETKIRYAASVEWARWRISEKAMSILMHDVFDTVKQSPDISIDTLILLLQEKKLPQVLEPRKRAHLLEFLVAHFREVWENLRIKEYFALAEKPFWEILSEISQRLRYLLDLKKSLRN